jgi:hypothetical protein
MFDYARDNGTYDLTIVNGDFVRVESTAAHQVSILLDAQGEYPDSPLVGVGLAKYVDANGAALPDVITEQFMMDGMEVDNLVVNPAGFSENTETIMPGAFYK